MAESDQPTQGRPPAETKSRRGTSLRVGVPKIRVNDAFEREAQAQGYRFMAGVDEVGRGPLAGPVVAAALIWPLGMPWPEGLNDSKKLSAARREKLAATLRAHAVSYAFGQVEAEEIDRSNILIATKNAMLLAIGSLSPAADYLLIDALQLRESSLPQKAIIQGDATVASIAAASIVAKTYRDNLMHEWHKSYPRYGFDRHAGYGTAAHLKALRDYGPCPLHRRSFRGVLPE